MGKAKVAKNIAYVLVPIFVVLLMLATMGTAVIDEHVIITEDDYYVWKMAKGLTEITKEYTPAIIPVSITILIILASIIIKGIGANKGKDSTQLNWFDRWKFEFVLCLTG